METLKGQGASYIEPEKENNELFSNKCRENMKIKYEQITTIIRIFKFKGKYFI